MSYPVLARRDEALTDDETSALLRDRLGDVVVEAVTDFGELTIVVAPAGWHRAVTVCRDEDLLAFDLFDCLFGVDAGDDGLDVVAVLYSTSKGRRILLRTRCVGGRDQPSVASVSDVYVGANWHEREAFDMFGIDFDDHPGLLPRILCVENFEGWPLRKDFPLASRVAKPWPGVKDPAEPDADGNIVVREPAIGEAPGPSGLDEIIARQAREANPAATDDGSDGDRSGPADAASEEPVREEVQLDQATYDRLIGEGKSERIARSKAKAAFIKRQRAQAAEDEAAATASAVDAEAPARDDEADADDPEVPGPDAPAPDSPDAAPGAGTEGATADEAAPDPSVPGGDDSTPEDGSASPAAVDDDAAATAADTAEQVRAAQVAAREARAAEHDVDPADRDPDVRPIPEGTPPPEDEGVQDA